MMIEVNSPRYVAAAEEMDGVTVFTVEDRVAGESTTWSTEGVIWHAYVVACYLKVLHRLAHVGLDVVQNYTRTGPRKFPVWEDPPAVSCHAVRVR